MGAVSVTVLVFSLKKSTFQFHQKNKVNLLFFQRAPRPRLEVSYIFLFPIFAKFPETLSLIISDILAYYKDYGHLISIDFMQSNRSYSSLKLRKPSKISSKMPNFYMLAWREDPLSSLDDHDQLVWARDLNDGLKWRQLIPLKDIDIKKFCWLA